MNAFSRKFYSVLWLTGTLSLHSYGTPPGFPSEEARDNPPSGQSFRQWTERQRLGSVGTQAPGANISVVQSDQPVRVPFFVVSFKDSPAELIQNKAAIIDKLKERIFGNTTNPGDSLQGYYNQLFSGKLSFFDPVDIIPLELDGVVADYFSNKEPTRKLFEDVKEALSHTQLPLEVYNNKQLNGQSNDTTSSQDELDLVVIFALARSDQGIWPLRWWYEWTRDQGSNIANPSGLALPLTDPNSHKTVKLSNYCVLPVLGPAGQNDVIGYNFLAHEILHAFGLPDLYDRTDDSAGCGGWCCMGWGLYGGVKSVASPWQTPWTLKPVWPSAWCRHFLGLDRRGTWQDWERSEGDAQLVSPLNGEGRTFFRVELPGQPSPVASQGECEHYLLIEFRGPGLEKNGTPDWDEQLPGTGFLIWEISENVGRRDPLTGAANGFWPCVYRVKPGFPKQGQNDSADHPLVGLWRPDLQGLKNLDKTAILQKEQLWSQDGQVFKHPDGVVLSHFRQNGKTGTLHYRIEMVATSSAPSSPTIASVPQTLPPPQPSATVTEVVGTPPDLVSTKLPTEVSDRLKNVFAAYPKLNHSIATQDNQVKSLALPASVNSKEAFAKDVSSHVDLLNGKPLGDSRAQIISPISAPQATPSKASMTNLFKGTQDVAKNIGVKIGDKRVRVAGSHVDIQRQEDGVRYFFSNPVTLPSLPKAVPTSVSKVAVTQFFQEHFRGAIPKNAVVELVIENKTGKLKWQCRVPTVPTSGPVTIEIDAADPNGLSDKTAIVVK